MQKKPGHPLVLVLLDMGVLAFPCYYELFWGFCCRFTGLIISGQEMKEFDASKCIPEQDFHQMGGGGSIQLLANNHPFLWVNLSLDNSLSALRNLPISREEITDAENRLERFGSLLATLFEELEHSSGIIESELMVADGMFEVLKQECGYPIEGGLFIKADHSLPVAGSVKARGGIYEVLCFAEELCVENNLLNNGEDYRSLASDRARSLFGQYTICVGSTGNLGLSIGIMAAALGFKARVHMSIEAKSWKKNKLRKHGVEVVEHVDDYSSAVAAGRAEADQDVYSYFVDDESSKRLFLGYSVAASRLKKQLGARGVLVDGDHPLFVYIPCGVGGAPGGITFGLKATFGPNVHCFFAEPTQAPCMLLGMAAGFENNLDVFDIGLKLHTEADGLAVPQASRLVVNMMKPLLSGVFTVSDEKLFEYLYLFDEVESIRIEPSAAAGFAGPILLCGTKQGREYVANQGLDKKMSKANHIIWTTGGCLVPPDEFKKFKSRGEAYVLSNSATVLKGSAETI